MAVLVMKFGGTSVASIEHIRHAAGHVAREVGDGHHVAVVVSAMAGTTDQLVKWTADAHPLHDAREYDAVVSAGEQITAGLMAIALQARNIQARSWLGWQLPVHTSDSHGAARILRIETDDILERFRQGQVAVIAGFQGLGPDNRLTTFGRGGSDTSAVALAAALGAERCDIYSDVDGIHTADPRIVAKSRRIDKIFYEEMLELASLGSRVLQTRSVRMAMVHQVRLLVRNSADPTDAPHHGGTLVCSEEETMEQEIVSGIAYARDEAKITLIGIADKPGVAANLLGPLAAAEVNVDMIIQNISADPANTDLTFTVTHADLPRTLALLEEHRESIGYNRLLSDTDVVKVSVVGVGMRSHAGVAQRMFQTLADKGINIQVISTSEIKISVLIEAQYAELAVRALHETYGLDSDDESDGDATGATGAAS